jgi:hypothetical protein
VAFDLCAELSPRIAALSQETFGNDISFDEFFVPNQIADKELRTLVERARHMLTLATWLDQDEILRKSVADGVVQDSGKDTISISRRMRHTIGIVLTVISVIGNVVSLIVVIQSGLSPG